MTSACRIRASRLGMAARCPRCTGLAASCWLTTTYGWPPPKPDAGRSRPGEDRRPPSPGRGGKPERAGENPPPRLLPERPPCLQPRTAAAAGRRNPGGSTCGRFRRRSGPCTSVRRASSAARRSGVSRPPASVSRIHSICDERARGCQNTSATACRPPERTRSSGSWPSGRLANRRLLPGFSSGSASIDRAIGGAAAGAVAVEAQDRLVGHLPEQRRAGRR